MLHVSMLRKYIVDPSYVLKAPLVEPVGIADQKLKELRNKVISIVKVLWKSDIVEEMTWKIEKSKRSRYPYLFTK